MSPGRGGPNEQFFVNNFFLRLHKSRRRGTTFVACIKIARKTHFSIFEIFITLPKSIQPARYFNPGPLWSDSTNCQKMRVCWGGTPSSEDENASEGENENESEGEDDSTSESECNNASDSEDDFEDWKHSEKCKYSYEQMQEILEKSKKMRFNSLRQLYKKIEKSNRNITYKKICCTR